MGERIMAAWVIWGKEHREILEVLIKQTSPTNPPASENMKEVLEEAISNIKEEDRNIDFLYNLLRYQKYRNKYFGSNKSDYWADFDKKYGGRLSEEAMTAISSSLNLLVSNRKVIKCPQNKKSQANLEPFFQPMSKVMADLLALVSQLGLAINNNYL